MGYVRKEVFFMQAVKVQQFFEKNLLYMIAVSIGLGIAYGLYSPQGAMALKPLVPATLFLMLYPMMIGIQVEQIGKAAKNSRLILLAVFLNFLVVSANSKGPKADGIA